MDSVIRKLYKYCNMTEQKKRLRNLGIKQSKAREFLGIGESHFSKCLNDKAILSEKLHEKLEYFLEQYEKVKL